jgi:histidinol phosphatase-like PHP family hydrolase
MTWLTEAKRPGHSQKEDGLQRYLEAVVASVHSDDEKAGRA